MAENIRATVFKNTSDIDAFFKKYDANGFTDWFNKNHAGKNGFAKNGTHSEKKVTDASKWAQVWMHIKDIFNRDSINLVEFLAINTIIINETGGSFKPISEGTNNNSASSHPGIAYAFDRIPNTKKSYNTLKDGGNKTAYELYRDADFKSAHGHKPFGNILSDTTDVRWQSDTFPVGFSGGSVVKEVDGALLSNTFIGESDFQKFRGRGFIQTTGRGNYKKIIEYIISYSGNNKTILNYKSKWSQHGTNYDKIATFSSNKDWDDLFTNSDSIIPCYAVYVHGKPSGYLSINVTEDSNMKSGIKKVASKISGSSTKYINLFDERVYQQINGLEGNQPTTPAPEPTPTIATEEPVVDNSTFNTNGDDSDDAFLKFLEETDREEVVDNGNTNGNNSNSEENQQDAGSTGTVENVMKPTIKIEPIAMDIGDSSTTKSDVAGNLGFFPFVWYNGIQIQYADISSFNLSSSSLLPTVVITFFDSTNLMDEAGFPLDDTKLKVFLNPRKIGFKPIMIEFKISSFAITSNKTYIIEGIMNVNRFYLKKYEAYTNMSSYDTLVDFCKKAEVGFNSNIKNTDDKMNWISVGESGSDFVNSIIDYSYVSDDGFMWGFVDFYYCFNYIDIETEFKREIDSIDGLDGSGGVQQGLKSNIGSDTQKLFLTNDKSMSDSGNYFSNHSIMNNSTSISLSKGYLNTVKFYDRNSKDFMVFDIDSITSEGDKTIIMKGSPQDENYFKEHTTTTLMGKLDVDNMHKNYHYAWVQNSQNIEDLTKVGLKLQLPNPNFNLYRFQKINVIVSNNTKKFAKDFINHRLSGAWLITDIAFIFTNGQFKQEVTLVKRELGLSPEEVKNEGVSNANNTPNPSNASPSDSGADNEDVFLNLFEEQGENEDIVFTENGVEKDVKVTEPPKPKEANKEDEKIESTKHKLDLISGEYLVNNKVDKIKLCQINGKPVNVKIADALLDMLDYAIKNRYNFTVTSGFRPPYDEINTKSDSGVTVRATSQQKLYDSYLAGKGNLAAKPGQSNHGNGISVDLSTGSRKASSQPQLNEKLYIWLVENSWKFGFVRGVNTEEWHFDYLPNIAKQGPYAKLGSNNKNSNRFYTDLGLDKLDNV